VVFYPWQASFAGAATNGDRLYQRCVGEIERLNGEHPVASSKVVSRDVTSSVTGREKKKSSRRVHRLGSTRLLTRMFPNGSSTLTLKQRLTALTQPPSSSSSPRSSPLRRKFSAPWVKRTVAPCGHQNEDRLQVIISKMIYQAGVDYEYPYPHVMMLYNR
jgi:hypothetical protein